MDRHIQTKAIVLAVRKYGDLHKSVTLLSPDLGLFDAKVYGSRKGKKTAMAPLFSINNAQIYHNREKKDFSLTEAESTFIADSITQDLKSTYAAAFFCELVTKAPSDEPERTFSLLRDALLALEKIPELKDRIIINFIWKLMDISGTAPSLAYCPVCDRAYQEDEILLFSNSLNAPTCKACSDNTDLVLPPGARRYLRCTKEKTFLEAIEVEVSETAQKRILSYMLRWTTLFIQSNLKTLSFLNL